MRLCSRLSFDYFIFYPISDMEKYIKKYHLKDPQQYEDEREYWRSKTPGEKLEALEAIRETWHKLNPEKNGNKQGFRRVIRIIKQK